jgi:hypothetical protein
MNPHILEIFQRTHRAGPAYFPPGELIQEAIRWDSYFNFYSVATHYVFKISVSMISTGADVVRVKQTINLDGDGLHRKHEAAFAFPLDALTDVTLNSARSHPGIQEMRARGMRVPQGYSGHWEDNSPGDPAAIQLTFNTPIQVRRWSCMPITAGVVEQELALFDISLWFTSPSVANFAREKLLLAREEWLASPLSDSRLSSGVVIPAPQFGDIPLAPPGGINRGF